MSQVVCLILLFIAVVHVNALHFLRPIRPSSPNTATPHIVFSPEPINPNDRLRASGSASYFQQPSDLMAIYNIPVDSTAGAGKTIGIVDAYGASTIEADLAYFSSYYNLPACTTANGCFRKVDQTGGTNYPTDNAGWSLETALDVEWSHAFAPGAKILLVVANSANSNDLAAAIRYASANSDYVSMSFGGSEGTYYESIFGSSSYSAVSYFASTGDNGAGVSYPSSSPNVVAVGGTTIYRSNRAFTEEDAWSGSGGGCSTVFTAPSFQSSNSNYASFNCNGKRSVPDVSYLADPNSGVLVYTTSQGCTGNNCFYIVGGTSLASPLFAARAARRGAVVRPSYVYANNIVFRDIVAGSNGLNATVGLDQATGLGSWIGDVSATSTPTTTRAVTTTTSPTTTRAPSTTTRVPSTTTTTSAPTTTKAPTTTRAPTTRTPTTTRCNFLLCLKKSVSE